VSKKSDFNYLIYIFVLIKREVLEYFNYLIYSRTSLLINTFDGFQVLFQTFISQFFFLHAHLFPLIQIFFPPQNFEFYLFSIILGCFHGDWVFSSFFLLHFHFSSDNNSFSFFIRSAKIRRKFHRINKLKTERRSLLICIRFIKTFGLDFIEL